VTGPALDLLQVGERLADLDLYVRQLDDGSLTLATDDALPDGERVHVQSGPRGLRATLRLADAPQLTPDLARALDLLNRGSPLVGYVRRGDAVLAQVELPPSASGPAPNHLHLLFGALVEAKAQRADDLRAVIAGVKTPQALAAGDSGALPPSYLPGTGQKGGDQSLTKRYGGLEQVPGRAEVAPAEKPIRGSSRAPQPPRPRPQKSGARGCLVALAVVGGLLLVLGAAVAAGLYWLASEAQDAVERAKKDMEAELAAAEDADDDDDEDEDEDEDDGGDWEDYEADDAVMPTPDIRRPPPRRSPSEPDLPADREELLELVRGDPLAAGPVVKRWSDLGHDEAEGARVEMLEALGGTGEHEAMVGRYLLKSIREHPPSVAEAIECMPHARAGLLRELVAVLARAPAGQREEAADYLEGVRDRDTGDRMIEEALISLGRVDEGSLGRLVEARGPEWLLLGRGRDLLRQVARRDVALVRPLLEHPDEEIRQLVIDEASATEGQTDDVLRLLAGALRDDSDAVRRRAIDGFVALGDPKASWPLSRALVGEDDRIVRDKVRDAISRLPAADTIGLLERLADPRRKARDRMAALLGLIATGEADAMPPVIGALDDPERAIRLEAVRALSQIHGADPALRPKVVEGLAKLREVALSDPDDQVRRVAKQLHYEISGRFPR